MQMLKVSCRQINFNKNQSIKSLTLDNQYESNIIFKVLIFQKEQDKSQRNPNRGFIKAKSSVSFIIKSIKKEKFEAKVLFTYGFIDNKYDQFNEQWEKVKKNKKLEHLTTLQVRRIEDFEVYEKIVEKNNVIQKPTKQKYSLDNKKNQKKAIRSNSPTKSSLKNKLPKRKKSAQEFSKQLYLEQQSNERVFYSSEQMQEIIEDLHEMQKSFANQKIQNIKLAQQLSISQAKLKEVTEDKMHIEIHKSIGIVCEEYHTTFTYLLILGLVCFVCGFLLGKIESETV